MTMVSEEAAVNYSPEDVTIKDGFWFTFEDGDDEVAAHGSAWNGKEIIYFNDRVVSETRAVFSRTSEHVFEAGSSTYKLEFHVADLLRGHIRARLCKDGKLIGEDTKMYIRNIREELWTPKLFGNLWKYAVVGVAIGTVIGLIVGFTKTS